MQVFEIALNDLKEYENNPRKNDKAVGAVLESIKAFGFRVPLIIDGENVIVAGHTRKKAAELLGLASVPCIKADDLTPEQIKAFRLADNKTAELSEWDFEKLERELAELAALEIDMQKFGFELSDFGAEKQATEDAFDVEEAAAEIKAPAARLGDVWALGRHRLICGDSTAEKTLTRLLSGARVDMIITDPPYNVDYEGAAAEKLKIQNDKMGDLEFYEFLKAAFSAADSKLKEGGAFYIWYATRSRVPFLRACEYAGWVIRQELIWVKNQLVFGRSDYQWRHEPCLYGWKGGGPHYFINDRTQTTVFEKRVDVDKLKKEELKELLREYMKAAEETPSTIIHEAKPQRNGDHPTMKPVALFSRLITNSSRKGESVLDMFGGSGTALIACEQLGRTCYTAELDPVYCDVIIKRWEALTGQKAARL